MRDGSDGPNWQPLVAALANPHSRQMFAELVLGVPPDAVGQDLGASRRRRALATLRGAGILRPEGSELVVDMDVFSRALASAPRPERQTGIDRFLTRDGRIDRYPTRPSERVELLAQVAERVMGVDEVIPEREVTDRLSRCSDDPVMLRRYMVDDGILERTRSGSEYARVVISTD